MNVIVIALMFLLACLAGGYVVWSATPTSYPSLIAVTNAISSVIVIGALIAAAAAGDGASRWLGLLAVGLASANIVGGFAAATRVAADAAREQPGPAKH